jgi:hypothetical protein
MVLVSPVGVPPVFVLPVAQSLDLPPPPNAEAPRPLRERDAIDIWIARWLRIRRKDLLIRYQCDPRRLYEIWEEKRFPGSRAKALDLFNERYPGLSDRVDFGLHRSIPKAIPPELQPGLFDDQA